MKHLIGYLFIGYSICPYIVEKITLGLTFRFVLSLFPVRKDEMGSRDMWESDDELLM